MPRPLISTALRWPSRGLQTVFDQLVPYFVCRTLLEQQLEEARQAVVDAQQAVKDGRRAYHQALA